MPFAYKSSAANYGCSPTTTYRLAETPVVELDLTGKRTERLDVAHLDFALIHLNAKLFFNLLRDLLCGNRAEKLTALASLLQNLYILSIEQPAAF